MFQIFKNSKLFLRCKDIINHRISLKTDKDLSIHNCDYYDPGFDFEGVIPF